MEKGPKSNSIRSLAVVADLAGSNLADGASLDLNRIGKGTDPAVIIEIMRPITEMRDNITESVAVSVNNGATFLRAKVFPSISNNFNIEPIKCLKSLSVLTQVTPRF